MSYLTEQAETLLQRSFVDTVGGSALASFGSPYPAFTIDSGSALVADFNVLSSINIPLRILSITGINTLAGPQYIWAAPFNRAATRDLRFLRAEANQNFSLLDAQMDIPSQGLFLGNSSTLGAVTPGAADCYFSVNFAMLGREILLGSTDALAFAQASTGDRGQFTLSPYVLASPSTFLVTRMAFRQTGSGGSPTCQVFEEAGGTGRQMFFGNPSLVFGAGIVSPYWETVSGTYFCTLVAASTIVIRQMTNAGAPNVSYNFRLYGIEIPSNVNTNIGRAGYL